jgi:hypothetical protein
MKKIKYLFMILPAVIVMASTGCTETAEGFLDDKAEALTLASIFSDSLKTEEYVATVYWQIPSAVYAPRKAGWFLTDYEDYSSATDDGKEVLNSRLRFCPAFMKADFTQNGINADFQHFMNCWTAMYSNIRICNQVMNMIDGGPLSQQRKDEIKMEIRFLRAFYYFHLLRNFGGVPLVGDNMLSPFENYDLTRATFEETVNYIASEFEYVAAPGGLPDVQPDQRYGRPTKGAALAMLVKLYHYAASPLSNGGNMGVGENRLLVGYGDYQVSRWEKAKEALQNFYDYNDMGSYYGLVGESANLASGTDGRGFYTATTSRSSRERIWFWLNAQGGGNKWPHEYLLPKSRRGNPKIVPYHELTEAFPTIDGRDIRKKNSEGLYYPPTGEIETGVYDVYNPDSPYVRRDPRFDYTFIYNERKWTRVADDPNPNPVVYTYQGAQNDGIFDGGGSPTGYYYRKICFDNVIGNATASASTGMGMSLVRYADILLMDAEIMTEIDVDAYRTEIEKCLFRIRNRAGILPGDNLRYGVPENMNKDEMIDFILNERRVEFVIEAGNRFWDLQRRKLFDVLNRSWSHAAVWKKVGEEGDVKYFTWSVEPVEQHYFQDKMYHLPIPLKEFGSAKGKLIQNPGW